MSNTVEVEASAISIEVVGATPTEISVLTSGTDVLEVTQSAYIVDVVRDEKSIVEVSTLPFVNAEKVNNAALEEHIQSTTPHPQYDDLPSLRLLFENGLI